MTHELNGPELSWKVCVILGFIIRCKVPLFLHGFVIYIKFKFSSSRPTAVQEYTQYGFLDLEGALLCLWPALYDFFLQIFLFSKKKKKTRKKLFVWTQPHVEHNF